MAGTNTGIVEARDAELQAEVQQLRADLALARASAKVYLESLQIAQAQLAEAHERIGRQQTGARLKGTTEGRTGRRFT